MSFDELPKSIVLDFMKENLHYLSIFKLTVEVLLYKIRNLKAVNIASVLIFRTIRKYH